MLEIGFNKECMMSYHDLYRFMRVMLILGIFESSACDPNKIDNQNAIVREEDEMRMRLLTRQLVCDKETAKKALDIFLSKHIIVSDIREETAIRSIKEYVAYMDVNSVFLMSRDVKEFVSPENKRMQGLIQSFKLKNFDEISKLHDLYRQGYIFHKRTIDEMRINSNLLEWFATYVKMRSLRGDSRMCWASTQEEMKKNIYNNFFRFAFEYLKNSKEKVNDINLSNIINYYESYIDSEKSIIIGENQQESDMLMSNLILISVINSCDRFSKMWGNMGRSSDPIKSLFGIMGEESFYPSVEMQHDGNDFVIQVDHVCESIAKDEKIKISKIDGVACCPGISMEKIITCLAGPYKSQVMIEGIVDKRNVVLLIERDSVKRISEKSKKSSCIHIECKNIKTIESCNKMPPKLLRNKVSYAMFSSEDNKNILCLTLPSFYVKEKTGNMGRMLGVANDVYDIMYNVSKQHSIDAVVIDLRNNLGGAVFTALDLIGLFVGKKVVCQELSRQDGKLVETNMYSTAKKVFDGPLVVLVNENSASASELFATAIKNEGRGVIVGTKSTFGKGVGQFLMTASSYGKGVRQVKDLSNIKKLKSVIEEDNYRKNYLKLNVCFFSATAFLFKFNNFSPQMHGVNTDINLNLSCCRNNNRIKSDDIDPKEVSRSINSKILENKHFESLKISSLKDKHIKRTSSCTKGEVVFCYSQNMSIYNDKKDVYVVQDNCLKEAINICRDMIA